MIRAMGYSETRSSASVWLIWLVRSGHFSVPFQYLNYYPLSIIHAIITLRYYPIYLLYTWLQVNQYMARAARPRGFP
jgi:hypothetical protein